jgi:hypothetical protein
MSTEYTPGVSDPTGRSLVAYWERFGYPEVFISFRSKRDADMQGAGFVYHSLVREFGFNTPFCSEYSIPAGAYAETVMNAALQHAQVLAVIVGPGWADSLETRQDQRGHPWVIHEVATALDRHMSILPVMITNRRRIEGNLPPRIAPVAGFQTIHIPVVNDVVDERHPAIDPLDVLAMWDHAAVIAKYIGVVLCPSIVQRKLKTLSEAGLPPPQPFELPTNLFGDYDEL